MCVVVLSSRAYPAAFAQPSAAGKEGFVIAGATAAGEEMGPSRIVAIQPATASQLPAEPEANVPRVVDWPVKRKLDTLLLLFQRFIVAPASDSAAKRAYRHFVQLNMTSNGYYHFVTKKEGAGRNINALDFARLDSLVTKKFRFEKAKLLYFQKGDTLPDGRISYQVETYHNVALRRGKPVYGRKTMAARADASVPVAQTGWRLSEVWLRE